MKVLLPQLLKFYVALAEQVWSTRRKKLVCKKETPGKISAGAKAAQKSPVHLLRAVF
ncbi:hypothetical protein [Desulfovibrio porci]|uniref:hypothetical protein n=1 Tax=Desulfovibrio porci TaxID=2605782 RepID=UPI0012B3084D|nr:hypothetical protein [Desulfovibrio porci]MDY3810826.1 hypothetical protein [Desulfovibrio porci]